MAITSDDKRESKAEESVKEEAALVEGSAEDQEIVPADTSEGQAKELGVERYVHGAFLAGGILLAYICGKILGAVWSQLADWPAAARAVPVLIRYPEEDREGFMLAFGAIVGAVVAIQLFRNHGVRHWANEVAAELAKVTWPNRETVVNGTVVVVIATAVGTVYVAVLDRFWGFLTNLVYGA